MKSQYKKMKFKPLEAWLDSIPEGEIVKKVTDGFLFYKTRNEIYYYSVDNQKGGNMLTRQELEAIKINLDKYPDPMPWDPVDAVRKLISHTEELELKIIGLTRQFNQALTGRGK